MVRRHVRDRFLFIERIVVAPEHRRQGIASQVYRAIERAAKPFDRAVTRVRTDPPDPAGLAFHTTRGYVEVAKQRLANGTTTTLLTKDLTGRTAHSGRPATKVWVIRGTPGR